MPRAFAARPRVLARPGAVIVAAPREVACDELRLARLEDYLQRRFPDLDITVTDRLGGLPDDGFVGASAEAASPPRETVEAVAAAVRCFASYGDAH